MVDKEQRICIVGGGPAGLSMAMYLEKKGYTNYTVYEKSDHVGGKALSPMMKVQSKGGTEEERTVEMGAFKGFDTYLAVRECEAFGGVTHTGGPSFQRHLAKADGTELKPPLFAKMKNAAKIKKLAKVLETKYKGYDTAGHRGVAQGQYAGICPTPAMTLTHTEGTNANLKDLALPFAEFLKRNECEEAAGIWQELFTAFGYGYFDEIPAAYVLKYLDALTVQQFASGSEPWTWQGGTQSIWEGVNRRLRNPAHLKSEVVNIDRKDTHVFITVHGKVEEFDTLILCTPLELFLLYGNPRPDERLLFEKIRYKQLLTMAVRPAGGNVHPMSCFFPENQTALQRGHLLGYYRRWTDAGGQPLVTYTLCNHDSMEPVSFEDAQEITLRDLEQCGYKAEAVESTKEWLYFPHVSPAEYAAGWYDKVEALQGVDHTYYAGEGMAFGNMEETVEYSRDLVERFF